MNENVRTELEFLELESAKFLSEEELDGLEDDVDFLLSLDKPVERNLPKITTFSMPSASTCSNNGKTLEENSALIFYYILCYNLLQILNQNQRMFQPNH